MTKHDPQQVSGLNLSDDEFIATFERGEFGGDAFPHRAHLRIAWLYVTRLAPEAAIDTVAAGIRNLAAKHGHEARYHETLTRAWVYVVAAAVAHSPRATFSSLLERNPQLLDKHLLLRHYSAALLASARARGEWVAPDVLPIPGAPA